MHFYPWFPWLFRHGFHNHCQSSQNIDPFFHFFPFETDVTLNSLVSEAFVRFFVELVGHYSLNMTVTERGERVFLREPFRKSHTSRSVRHFLDLFMETQMFAGFVQDRELRQSGVKGGFYHKPVSA